MFFTGNYDEDENQLVYICDIFIGYNISVL